MKNLVQYIQENGAIAARQLQLAQYGSKACNIDDRNIFQLLYDNIKSWWYDKRAKQIMSKLFDDDEIKNFLNQPKYKQDRGWRDLLKSKLSEDEYKYITRITKNKVKDNIK